MKKLIVSIAAVALCVSSYAQNFSWGVRAGLNISSISEKNAGEEDSGLKSKVGFNVGIMGDYAFSERLSIESGLYFSQLGAKANGEEADLTINLGYLQLPLLATYKFPISNNVKWGIQAGPYFGVGIGGKIKTEAGGVTLKVDSFGDGDSEEVGGFFQRFDMGLAFGTGVTISEKIYIGVKYDLGLQNLLCSKAKEGTGDYKMKNGNFSINVGYNF